MFMKKYVYLASMWPLICKRTVVKKKQKKHFKEKPEIATHNSSVIVFAPDRWAENPIILDRGELPQYPLNVLRHTD